MKPTRHVLVAALSLVVAAPLAGCGGAGWLHPEWLKSASLFSSQSPDDEKGDDGPGKKVKLIGDVAIPFGRDAMAVDGVGLVVGLPGTGSDPPQSVYRTKLLDEMRKRGVDKPEQMLASPNTALVLVRGYLRPGVQDGDRLDVEVRVPDRDETKSLRGGYLLPTQLTQTAAVQGEIKRGWLEAVAKGPIMIDLGADPKVDPSAGKQGRILGGGTAAKSHSLALLLKPDYQQFKYSVHIDHAITRRFQTSGKGQQRNEIAKPVNKEVIEVQLSPRYKDNVSRYLRVVQALPLKETPGQRIDRLAQLERQLLDPVTAATAAIRLEAIGAEGVDALLKGLQSQHGEVRFYAAEALAYVGHEKSNAAAVPLGEAARNEPAFRVFALSALSAMGEFEATEQLRNLLTVDSAETRYGAFRALWSADRKDPLVRGEVLGNEQGEFGFHLLRLEGPPMIHLTRSFRPEVVLFGPDISLATPLLLDAGSEIHLNGPPEGPITISRVAVDAPSQSRQVSPRVEEVVRTIVELGGTYPDVVQMLQQAAATGALPDCRLEIDALPQPGRAYTRDSGRSAESPAPEVRSPLPSLFSSGSAPRERKAESREPEATESTETTGEEGSWQKLLPW